MDDLVRIELFCEDSGHERFVRALVRRLFGRGSHRVDIQTRTGRGGHGRVITELRAWQRSVEQGLVAKRPDLVVIVIDANCLRWSDARRRIQDALVENLFANVVVGCPDPHVERWCLADPPAFTRVVGGAPLPDPGKCGRSMYKELLLRSIENAGATILTDEMEFAPDIVKEMDLYQAGKNQPSLGHFIEDLHAALAAMRLDPGAT